MNQDCLIIFTRYPIPGQTKTRLIPALGAEKSAHLQRQMTEYSLQRLGKPSRAKQRQVRIYFQGATAKAMAQWLGQEWLYYPQAEGDLGEKMSSAFAESFNDKINKSILIGVDCPEIPHQILDQGFKALDSSDLLLGPAKDGGYYLIGLNHLIPELFEEIHWGSSTVLKQTLDKAQQLKQTFFLLPELQDVDRPEDLWLWDDLAQNLNP